MTTDRAFSPMLGMIWIRQPLTFVTHGAIDRRISKRLARNIPAVAAF
jgi:hypothetical protein